MKRPVYEADKYITARQPYIKSSCTSQTCPVTYAVQCVRREARLKNLNGHTL